MIRPLHRAPVLDAAIKFSSAAENHHTNNTAPNATPMDTPQMISCPITPLEPSQTNTERHCNGMEMSIESSYIAEYRVPKTRNLGIVATTTSFYTAFIASIGFKYHSDAFLSFVCIKNQHLVPSVVTSSSQTYHLLHL